MTYLLETNLPDNKSIVFALTNIYGIGNSTALSICKKLGFSSNLKTANLSLDQITDLLELINSSNLLLNNDLKKQQSLAFNKLLAIKSYRGLRRVRNLPVRGQRTHTNAKSAKRHKHF